MSHILSQEVAILPVEAVVEAIADLALVSSHVIFCQHITYEPHFFTGGGHSSSGSSSGGGHSGSSSGK